MTRPESTAVARAARTRTKYLRWAAEMRAAGWEVTEPGHRDPVEAWLNTADLRAIADVLGAAGREECGAWEMTQIADHLGL